MSRTSGPLDAGKGGVAFSVGSASGNIDKMFIPYSRDDLRRNDTAVEAIEDVPESGHQEGPSQ